MNAKTLNFVLLMLCAALFFSCSSDDGKTVYPEEDFLEEYLELTGFNQEGMAIVNQPYDEHGIEFMPLKEGKIKEVSVKLPKKKEDLRITFWDSDTKMPIRTEIVNVASANTNYTFVISDLHVNKEKLYALTMNSGDWIERWRTDGRDIEYPVNTNNVKIFSYKWVSGTDQIYPEYPILNYYGGDVSFTFQQTEE